VLEPAFSGAAARHRFPAAAGAVVDDPEQRMNPNPYFQLRVASIFSNGR
jgi:hypothetical protein